MRPKRTHVLPLTRRLIAIQYRDRMPVKDICAAHNCCIWTVLKAARDEGVQVPRPKPPRKTKPRPTKTRNSSDLPTTYLPQK